MQVCFSLFFIFWLFDGRLYIFFSNRGWCSISTFVKRPNSLLRSCKQFWIGHCNGMVFMYANSALFALFLTTWRTRSFHTSWICGFILILLLFFRSFVCAFLFSFFLWTLPRISTPFPITVIFLKAFNKPLIVQFSAHFPPAFHEQIQVVWNYNKLYIFIQIYLCKKYVQSSVLTQDEEYFKIVL